MTKPVLLILDDELNWLNRHLQYFQRHKFTCVPTPFAKHAIHLGKELKTIRYGIIDHVLLDPTQFGDERENQRWQGKEVIQQIHLHRKNIKFIIVTQMIGPINRDQEEQKWMNDLEADGLIDIFHKDQIKISPDRTYARISNWLTKTSSSSLASASCGNPISPQDKNILIDILAKHGENHRNYQAFFMSLIRQANLPAPWIRQLHGQWVDLNTDSVMLVDWAINKGEIPGQTGITTLGNLFRSLRSHLGAEDLRIVDQIIDFYHL